jgi:hypothetical protein
MGFCSSFCRREISALSFTELLQNPRAGAASLSPSRACARRSARCARFVVARSHRNTEAGCDCEARAASPAAGAVQRGMGKQAAERKIKLAVEGDGGPGRAAFTFGAANFWAARQFTERRKKTKKTCMGCRDSSPPSLAFRFTLPLPKLKTAIRERERERQAANGEETRERGRARAKQ